MRQIWVVCVYGVRHFASIFESIKQFFVGLGLKIVRVLVQVKPHVLRAGKKASNPFRGVGRFFIYTVATPVYRLLFLGRRHFEKLYRPAKNKFMFFVTNRYSVHAILIGLVLFTVGMNLGTEDVRAESFGEQSLMYAIVTQTDNEIIEEFAATEVAVEYSSVQYRESTALSPYARGVDFLGSESSTVLVGGGALTAPTISDGAASTAPRTEIETYVAVSGDTFSTIAEQFGISLNTLLWSNNLSVRSVLKPGAELSILPTSGVAHKVSSGDTLNSIANKYDAEPEDILNFNRLASADDLVAGEQLIVPGGEVQYSAPSRSSAITSVITSPTTSTPTTTSTIAPSTSGSGRMLWPTDLYVITQYYGWRHTGIDIDCHYTNDNYAADYGVVQYSGWKSGYGYTVEINHGNGIVTRYGHHASLYVSAGQQVTPGQPLGRCGTTGRSTGTHLHFEVIVNGGFRNPLEYIK